MPKHTIIQGAYKKMRELFWVHNKKMSESSCTYHKNMSESFGVFDHRQNHTTIRKTPKIA